MKKIPAFLASSASAVYTNTFESLHILPGLLLLGVLLAACDPQSVIQANAPAAAFTLQSFRILQRWYRHFRGGVSILGQQQEEV